MAATPSNFLDSAKIAQDFKINVKILLKSAVCFQNSLNNFSLLLDGKTFENENLVKMERIIHKMDADATEDRETTPASKFSQSSAKVVKFSHPDNLPVDLDSKDEYYALSCDDFTIECELLDVKSIQNGNPIYVKREIDAHIFEDGIVMNSNHVEPPRKIVKFADSRLVSDNASGKRKSIIAGNIKIECEICHKILLSSGLANHMIFKHGSSSAYCKCHACNKSMTESYLKIHTKYKCRGLEVVTKPKYFECEFCKKQISSLAMCSHLRIHGKCTRYRCDICHEIFKRGKIFQEHMKKNHSMIVENPNWIILDL